MNARRCILTRFRSIHTAERGEDKDGERGCCEDTANIRGIIETYTPARLMIEAAVWSGASMSTRF